MPTDRVLENKLR